MDFFMVEKHRLQAPLCGKTDESLFLEMPVECESGCNPPKPHDLKTHPIDKTQLFPPSGKHCSHCSKMYRVVDPFVPENRDNIRLKHLDCRHSPATLHERTGFHKNIIGCYKGIRRC